MTAANWTLKAGMSAGKDTDTLSSALLKYYRCGPLTVSSE